MRRTSARSDGRLGSRLAAVAASMALLVAISLPMLAQAAPTGADEGSEDPVFVGELGRGDALFWDGPYLDSVGTGTRLADALLCDSPAQTTPGCGSGAWGANTPTFIVSDTALIPLGQEESPLCGSEQTCFAYTFDVTEPGDVLRVALDQPSLRDLIWVYLYDPSGAFVTRMSRSRAERWVEDPTVGRWEVRVVVDDARDTGFRMRAGLDPDGDRWHGRGRGGGPKEKKSGFLLPNLQVVAPFELGFGPCQATEIASYGAQRCLRFSSGPQNVGDGPLDLLVTETGALEGPMYQRLHRPDGSTETVTAGNFEYHLEHAHYHQGAIQSLELLRVVDERRGLLEQAGTGPKLGFCLLPYHIAEWESFAQDRAHDIYDDEACAGDVRAPVPTQMALARGFVDIYPWMTHGNFVDFGDNPDGLYVIRVASDPDSNLRETRDDDNHAYTYIRVTGDEIEVLERGIGADPWDPHGAVVDDTRRLIRWTE